MMEERLGRVTIAPDVLVTIVRLTTLSIPGVTRMSGSLTGNVDRFLGRAHVGEGVRLEIEDDSVSVELHIIVEPKANMLKLGRAIQAEVARAISEMVGMGVKQINVYIDNVDVEPGGLRG
jgi:uncharacterized alkaline shock family protein YloU